MSLRISREFTLGKALTDMGVDRQKLTRQEMRSLVCAQCHVTYSIPKDQDMHSTGVFFPWQAAPWGTSPWRTSSRSSAATPSYGEWKQTVTGFKLAFIRHPEYELFSNNSVHWKAGAACADCHMPYTRGRVLQSVGPPHHEPAQERHEGCMQCHTETIDWLKGQVFAIQDRTTSLMIRAGYATATVAKLFEKPMRRRNRARRSTKRSTTRQRIL